MAKTGERVASSTGKVGKKALNAAANANPLGMLAVNVIAEKALGGGSMSESLVRGAGFTAWQLASPTTFGMFFAGQVVGAGASGLNNLARKTTMDLETTRYNPNAQFQNNMGFNPVNQQLATMRQASVQAIQGSKLNARNALGNEASLQHRAYY